MNRTPMRRRLRPSGLMVAVMALGAAAMAGCKDKAEEISGARSYLDDQHSAWRRARESLHSEKPNLELLRVVGFNFSGPMGRRLKQDYRGPNKGEVLKRFDALNTTYLAQITSKLDRRSAIARLRQGVTIEQVRQAFDAMDDDYRAFEELTKK